jgi:hypothetical protein
MGNRVGMLLLERSITGIIYFMRLFCVEILKLAFAPGAPVNSLGMALSETWTFLQFLLSYCRGKDRISYSNLFLCALNAH